jgi:hypothetical protein
MTWDRPLGEIFKKLANKKTIKPFIVDPHGDFVQKALTPEKNLSYHPPCIFNIYTRNPKSVHRSDWLLIGRLR